MYLGDFIKGATVRFAWNASGANGASITRATNGTIHVYKDGVLTTEVTTGVTDTEDADTLLGVNTVAIDTTDAFYSAGSEFMVVIKAATIDGQVVNAVLAHFSLQRRTQFTPVTGLATAGAAGSVTLPVGASSVDNFYNGSVVSIVAGTGAGQARLISGYVGSTRVASVDPNWGTAPDATSVTVVALVAPAPVTATPNVNMASASAGAVTSIQSGLATSSALSTVASYLDTEVAAIKAKTDTLPSVPAAQSDIPSATAIRNAILSWEPFTGYSLARWFRVMGTVLRGTSSGQSGLNPSFTSPDGAVVVSGTIDAQSNRTAVSDNASNTP